MKKIISMAVLLMILVNIQVQPVTFANNEMTPSYLEPERVPDSELQAIDENQQNLQELVKEIGLMTSGKTIDVFGEEVKLFDRFQDIKEAYQNANSVFREQIEFLKNQGLLNKDFILNADSFEEFLVGYYEGLTHLEENFDYHMNAKLDVFIFVLKNIERNNRAIEYNLYMKEKYENSPSLFSSITEFPNDEELRLAAALPSHSQYSSQVNERVRNINTSGLSTNFGTSEESKIVSEDEATYINPSPFAKLPGAADAPGTYKYRAIQYAKTHATNPNTNSYHYFNTGDCTNFASQILEASGFYKQTITDNVATGWWHKVSTNFLGIKTQYAFLFLDYGRGFCS